MGARSNQKGKAWERRVAALLRGELGIDARRGQQARDGGDAPDVVVDLPFWIECKHGRQPNVRAALAQAIEASDGRTPVAVVKDDRREPMVVLRLRDALAWLRRGQV